jgi:hypothetical protein
MIWLGDKRGYLNDWVTQRWVQTTGCRLVLADHLWLDGPVGNTRQIGKDFFADYAHQNGLDVSQSGPRGLVESLSSLSNGSSDFSLVAPLVRQFYEQTSEYTLDSWSQWNGLFRPFGRALAVLFSRRLQQLNIPLSPLDSAKGMSSKVIQMRDCGSGKLIQTAWIRELNATRNVLYAGSYSICTVPGYPSPCFKVVFPLPNGNAIVVMRPAIHDDGSLSLTSAGGKFGDPGFYFVVHGEDGVIWARYVESMKESIHVYPAESGITRADHILKLWGKVFLRLHYRMTRLTNEAKPNHDSSPDTLIPSPIQ